jgi:hypothetical protein
VFGFLLCWILLLVVSLLVDQGGRLSSAVSAAATGVSLLFVKLMTYENLSVPLPHLHL